MNTTKIIILLLPFICTLLTRGQTLPVFNIDSLPIKCLVDIGGYQQEKILINGKNRA